MSHQRLNTAGPYLQSFRNGEERGFDYFFKCYYKALCFFAGRYINDRPAAEDIVEESFIKLWSNREQIQDEKHLRNYLYKSAWHACLRYHENEERKKKHIKGLSLISDKEEKSYLENITRTEMMRLLKEAMDQLPGECRKIFYKLFIEGKTVKEAAEELELTISTIHNQKARGIKLLRMRLGEGFIVFSFWFMC